MLLYGSIIFIFAAVTVGINALCLPVLAIDLGWALRWLAIGVVLLVLTDVVCVSVARLFPKKFYTPTGKFYQTQPWQTDLLLRLGIRHWKDRVPELGILGGFRKDKIDNLNADYLYRFLQENCFGEAEHLVSAVGSVIVCVIPWPYLLTVSIPLMLCNVLLNLMSASIQRYLRPKLMALYRRQKMKEQKESAA